LPRGKEHATLDCVARLTVALLVSQLGLFLDTDPSPQICKPFCQSVFGFFLPEAVFPCFLLLFPRLDVGMRNTGVFEGVIPTIILKGLDYAGDHLPSKDCK
jgi:hypothetical protein